MATSDIAALIAADDELLDRTVLPHGWPHEAPEQPFSAERAHQAMQRHAACTIERLRPQAGRVQGARRREAHHSRRAGGEIPVRHDELAPSDKQLEDARPMGWLQRQDESWSAVDEYGVEHPMTLGPYVADELDELDADVRAALDVVGQPRVIDVAPLQVSDTEVSK